MWAISYWNDTYICTIHIDIDCGLPPDIINGTYTLLNGTGVGSVATYSCYIGFQLGFRESLTCGDNGEWQGPVPRCLGKSLV